MKVEKDLFLRKKLKVVQELISQNKLRMVKLKILKWWEFIIKLEMVGVRLKNIKIKKKKDYSSRNCLILVTIKMMPILNLSLVTLFSNNLLLRITNSIGSSTEIHFKTSLSKILKWKTVQEKSKRRERNSQILSQS